MILLHHYKIITSVLLALSVLLFIMSLSLDAPELTSIVFGCCIVAYAITYPPWDGPDLEGRDRRSRITAILVFISFCVVLGMMVLQLMGSLYGVGEQTSLDSESVVYLSAIGIVVIAWTVCRSLCGVVYVVTGNARVLDWAT